MNVPLLARYNSAVSTAYNFVIDNIDKFPVDVFSVIRNQGWAIISYEDLANEQNCNISDVCNCFGNDGYSIYNGRNYTIAYNNKIENTGRINFTLMHEVGHIILGHHKDFESTLILKDNFSEAEYKILENEANCFARNVLCPAPLSQKVPFIFRALRLNDIFNISFSARNTRINFLKSDLNYLTSTQIFNMQQKYDTFYVCKDCKNNYINKDNKYCYLCGSLKLKKGNGLMIYKNEVELDENKKAKVCPRCGNEEILEGPYCKICGLELFNRCVNYDENNLDGCREICDANARYCHKCGAKTLYYNLNIISDYASQSTNKTFEELLANTDDLPF